MTIPPFKDTMDQKRLLLEVMSGGLWHRSLDLTNTVGIGWNQRKNELRREEGIRFEKRKGDKAYEYRLVTLIEKVDLDTCTLKPGTEKFNQTSLKIGDKFRAVDLGELEVCGHTIGGDVIVKGPQGIREMKPETLEKIRLEK